MFVGFVLVLILAAIVSHGARNLLSGALTLLFGVTLFMAGCAIV
jgi:hypothetical protein